jgi:Putative MetA-pathway of phenol degradation
MSNPTPNRCKAKVVEMDAIKRWRCVLAIAGAIEIFAPTFSVGEEPPSPPSSTQPPASTPSPSSTPSSAPELKTEGDRQKEAEELKRLQEFYLRNQSVFIRKGEIIVEFNNFYSFDQDQVFVQLAPGTATLVKSTRRFFDTTLFGRYGLLTDGLELDVIAPVFVHAEQQLDFATASTTTSSNGIGDMAGALRYQAWYESGWRPGVILDVQGKSRTGGNTLRGTNSYNVGGGVTLLKSIDPVVFFGRIGYTNTFEYQGVNRGNIVEYNVGMGFSLNDRVAFNMQVAGAFVGKTKVQGQVIEGSSLEIASLLFSTTILITKKLFIEPIVGIGMTEDAFDATFGVRIPYRF